MDPEGQRNVFLDLLRRFDEAGVLDQVMLIGSWCLTVYRSVLADASTFPVVRTLDADFLIPSQRLLTRDVNVPGILEQMGFVSTFVGSRGWVVYDHPELRVEFLVPARGQSGDQPHQIRKLHVNAQGLRYVNLLAGYPRTLSYQGLSVCVPEPAAYALQKLIVSARRTKAAKRQKDVEAALAVFRYVASHPQEQQRLTAILHDVPRGWIRTLERLATQHHLQLPIGDR